MINAVAVLRNFILDGIDDTLMVVSPSLPENRAIPAPGAFAIQEVPFPLDAHVTLASVRFYVSAYAPDSASDKARASMVLHGKLYDMCYGTRGLIYGHHVGPTFVKWIAYEQGPSTDQDPAGEIRAFAPLLMRIDLRQGG